MRYFLLGLLLGLATYALWRWRDHRRTLRRQEASWLAYARQRAWKDAIEDRYGPTLSGGDKAHDDDL